MYACRQPDGVAGRSGPQKCINKLKLMVIEIHGTNAHNRGAEMMAIEIAGRLRTRHPKVRICVAPDYGDSHDRSLHGFQLIPEFISTPQRKLLSACDRWASPSFARWVRKADFSFQRMINFARYSHCPGVVSPLEIDAIIDASGFAFSDQWGRHKAQNLFEKVTYRRRNVPLILMPQAMGPFKLPHVAPMCDLLLRRADLVFVRDRISLEMASELTKGEVDVHCYPDFTISLSAKRPGDEPPLAPYAAVIPNYRMVDKKAVGMGHLDFLERALKAIKKTGMTPVLLMHEGEEDSRFVPLLAERGILPHVIQHRDPLVLKHYLGGAEFVIGSRFHALVSTLSQGVPAIAAGWSHKYDELLRDFGVSEFLIQPGGKSEEVDAMVTRLAERDQRLALAARIRNAGASLKAANEEMWEMVFREIDRHLGGCHSESD